MSRRATAFLLLGGATGAVLLLALAARAEPLSLAWDAPAGCPSREAVMSEVERLLGRERGPSAIEARGTIQKGNGGYRLHMMVRREGSERARELTAPTCAELGDAAAVILALAIDPEALEKAPRPAPSDAGAAPPPPPKKDVARAVDPPAVARPKPAPRREPAPATKPEAPRPPRHLYAFGAVSREIGVFRGAVPRAQLGIAWTMPYLRLEAQGLFSWGGRIAAPADTSASGEMWLAGGAVSGCAERQIEDGRRAGTFGLCATFELGALHATSFGVTRPSQATAPWFASGGGFLLRLPVSERLALRLDAGVAVRSIELSFSIGGLGVVHEPASVSLRSGLGVELDIF